MKIVHVGELVHLIERRMFAEDVRRHFVAKIEAVSERGLRLRGYLFVYESGSSTFLKKPEERTRVVGLDNRIILNVLPEGMSLDSLRYSRDAEGNLCLVDGGGFELDISEFSPKE